MIPDRSSLVEVPVTGLNGSKTRQDLLSRLQGVAGLSDVEIDQAAQRVRFRVTAGDGQNGQLQRVVQELKNLGLHVQIAREEVDIFNLRCAACVATLETGLKKIPGISDAKVNFATQTGMIEYIDGVYDRDRLLADIRAIGYEAGFHSDQAVESVKTSRLRRDLLVSILCTAGVFGLHVGEHVLRLFMIPPVPSALVQLALTIPVIYAGRIFFADAVRQLRHRRANMNSLIALGSGTAVIYSLFITYRLLAGLVPGHPVIYFDTAAMIITFILIGRYLEDKATQEARDAATGISDLIPQTVNRMSREGVEETIGIGVLAIGDKVIVRPGQSIPADGIVLDGETTIDESMLTGEAMPVAKTAGDAVTGGTVNLSKGITMTVMRVGGGTVLARMIRMVRDAQAEKAPIQRLADRVAAVFVPIVVALAALTLVVWMIIRPGSEMVLLAPVAVLLVACPCAMGLATPTAILVGTGRAARLGVLFRNGAVLEKLSRVNFFVFDKTGTLTEGRPLVEQIIPAEGTRPELLLQMAASAEQYSEHPLAAAIRERARREGLRLLPVKQHTITPGEGVLAEVDRRRVVIGRRSFIAASGMAPEQQAAMKTVEREEAMAVVHVAMDGRYLGAITLNDAIKPGAPGTVRELSRRGYEVIMLTGDNSFSAAAVAGKVGIKRIEAEASPETKLVTIKSLRHTGSVTAMVGDGVNDAAALTAADIGIALGTGTDIAIKASDITITGRSLESILTAIEVSRNTLKIIRQTLFWAFFYNVIMIPAAAGLFYPITGWVISPVLAAAAMAVSSIFVVTNSLRLRRLAPVHIERNGR